MAAYYNEIDPHAAQWLRNLIAGGHIAPGDVDERSIEDVHPDDIRSYTQCHFFAGVGVWSYALRRAGWADDRHVWTGSCPCQPFSAAGKGSGFDDERHLWPAFYHLIQECQPAVVFGEQVASKDADAWIDLVSADLEALDYAVGAVPFPAASVGAPHIRDRLYWVADANNKGLEGRGPVRERADQRATGPNGLVGGMADLHGERFGETRDGGVSGGEAEWPQRDSRHCRVADTHGEQRSDRETGVGYVDAQEGRKQGSAEVAGLCNDSRPSPVNGFWRDADWLLCRDGKWRPVEPGTFPLAHGAPARVGRLRAYGNAIVAPQAQVFIEAFIDARAEI